MVAREVDCVGKLDASEALMRAVDIEAASFRYAGIGRSVLCR